MLVRICTTTISETSSSSFYELDVGKTVYLVEPIISIRNNDYFPTVEMCRDVTFRARDRFLQ